MRFARIDMSVEAVLSGAGFAEPIVTSLVPQKAQSRLQASAFAILPPLSHRPCGDRETPILYRELLHRHGYDHSPILRYHIKEGLSS
jgi:hypothetical protein